MRTFFFATHADMKNVIETIERDGPLKYIQAGMFETADLVEYNSGIALPDLGIARRGDYNHEPYYLVTEPLFEVVPRAVPQRRGGTRYAIDQALNPQTIVFWPCGSYKDEVIVSGQVSTGSSDTRSKKLYRRFRQAIVKAFVQAGQDYVGPEALSRARAGTRLTGSVRSPRTYDLRV